MRIGVDFDGTIGDDIPLLESAIKKYLEKYEISAGGAMTYERFQKFGVPMDVFRDFFRKAYEDRALTSEMNFIEGAVDAINGLQSKGHEISIITSRSGIALENAKGWLKENGNLDLPFYDKGGHANKSLKCKQLRINVFIDDEFSKLKELIHTVPYLFLLENKYNLNDELILREGIEKFSWEYIYHRIV